jgi:hypothetical protein
VAIQRSLQPPGFHHAKNIREAQVRGLFDAVRMLANRPETLIVPASLTSTIASC